MEFTIKFEISDCHCLQNCDHYVVTGALACLYHTVRLANLWPWQFWRQHLWASWSPAKFPVWVDSQEQEDQERSCHIPADLCNKVNTTLSSVTNIIVIINEYYYSAVESKKLQEHLTTEKNKTNDSIMQDKNRSQTVGDQKGSVSSVVTWRRSNDGVKTFSVANN